MTTPETDRDPTDSLALTRALKVWSITVQSPDSAKLATTVVDSEDEVRTVLMTNYGENLIEPLDRAHVETLSRDDLVTWLESKGGLYIEVVSHEVTQAYRIPSTYVSEAVRFDEENVRGCSCGEADFGTPGHDGGPAIVRSDESEYRITYEVDVTAASPSQAARLAHEMMTDPTSLPPVLTVKHVASGATEEVDLHAE